MGQHLFCRTLLTPDVALAASRSGGRAGGRASSASMRSSPRPVQRIERTTVIQQAPPIYAPPPVVIAPAPMYSPFGGLGLGLGINAIEGIGREMRESGQKREIAKERAELEVAKQRQADLEARLRALESQPR